jgi:phosphomannomutase/phosphomannomutase/phosphoglucomutase
MQINCFKAYDVRGRIPDELNEDIARRIGRAYAAIIRPEDVVVGRDIRLTSDSIAKALSEGLTAGGADVLDIGLCGTEEVYFATSDQKASGGIMVTASHNPMDFNGMKFVREDSRPISGDSGLGEIRALAESGKFPNVAKAGRVKKIDVTDRFVTQLLTYVQPAALRHLKIVVNAGNGNAGPIIDRLEPHLPFELVKVHHEPDGSFPNGIPNPLLPENRAATADAVIASHADLGVAWDGDFDRCFLFDEQGRFIEGYYIVGLLAEAFLVKYPGAKIVHDPRLTWNTIDIVRRAGGIPIQSKTGHAFIKERMRLEDAVYGGEMSAHHYFRDFAYCDSGMIPWLLVAEMISRSSVPLSEMLAKRIDAFPASGEINRQLADPAGTLKMVEQAYKKAGGTIDHTDGLSMEFPNWRFNLRSSNTEPLVRLNVESRGDRALMEVKTEEILGLLTRETG